MFLKVIFNLKILIYHRLNYNLQIVGLGKSGKAAARLALARGASVIGIDQNENLSLLEVQYCLSLNVLKFIVVS